MTAQLEQMLADLRPALPGEIGLQDAIAAALTSAGATFTREMHIDQRSRIDFAVGRVGIEVKVKGSIGDVARQVQRYARSGLFDVLLVATTCPRHTDLPDSLAGIPIRVIVMSGGAW
jgi:hypothetical protein